MCLKMAEKEVSPVEFVRLRQEEALSRIRGPYSEKEYNDTGRTLDDKIESLFETNLRHSRDQNFWERAAEKAKYINDQRSLAKQALASESSILTNTAKFMFSAYKPIWFLSLLSLVGAVVLLVLSIANFSRGKNEEGGFLIGGAFLCAFFFYGWAPGRPFFYKLERALYSFMPGGGFLKRSYLSLSRSLYETNPEIRNIQHGISELNWRLGELTNWTTDTPISETWLTQQRFGKPTFKRYS